MVSSHVFFVSHDIFLVDTFVVLHAELFQPGDTVSIGLCNLVCDPDTLCRSLGCVAMSVAVT